MKPTCLLACVVSLAIHSVVAAAPIDIYLVAGQSNQISFQAPASALPAELHLQTDVLFRGTTGLVTPLQPMNDKFGPEMTFARSVADARAQLGLPQMAISKYAVGSTSLAVDWFPGEYGSDPRIGIRYKNMIYRAKGAATMLKQQGFQPRWAGMLWLQGETDAGDLAMAEAYEENLRLLINRVRSDLLVKSLPVAIAEIHAPTRLYRSIVRAGQEEVAATMPNVFIFDTDDLTLVDRLHYDPAGVMEIGRRYASVLPLTTLSRSTGGIYTVPEPPALALAFIAIAGAFVSARRRADESPNALRHQ